MNEQHTPEPWEVQYEWCDCGGEYPCGHGQYPYEIVAPNTLIPRWHNEKGTPAIVTRFEGDDSNETNMANARRIIAAVNACKGISTEALESGVVAELLAACKRVETYFSGSLLSAQEQSIVAQLRSAVAKAQSE